LAGLAELLCGEVCHRKLEAIKVHKGISHTLYPRVQQLYMEKWPVSLFYSACHLTNAAEQHHSNAAAGPGKSFNAAPAPAIIQYYV
jgi:hypothetical protein